MIMDDWRVIEARLGDVFSAIKDAGGRPLIVGGYVRDHLRGIPSKDIDVEIFGLNATGLHALLGQFGDVIAIGRAFGVFRLKDIDVDFSLPRLDNKVAPGHRGFEVTFDPNLDFSEAARRRDFTINSMGWDPLGHTLLDPHGGQADLEANILRVTDREHFAEDPLRALRAAQFIARFELNPSDELVTLCTTLDLSELPAERIGEEFRKLLLKGVRPSLGLRFLHRCGLLHFFPELGALVGVPQDPIRHPEGDVWAHTLLTIDEAASRRQEASAQLLMLAALCHDLGKPATTEVDALKQVSSPAHDAAGVACASTFLARLAASSQLTNQVGTLVASHLAPALLVEQRAGAKAYCRLARKLETANVELGTLLDLASADHLGRSTADALARRIPWLSTFQAQAAAALVDNRASAPVVSGRHLIARGMKPGPEFRRILDTCLAIQDETDLTDAEAILERVLNNSREG